MFTAIFFVWGIFLWKASSSPAKNETFINFTIWATVAHLFAMLIIGLIKSGDLVHMLKDITVQLIPLILVIFNRKNGSK